jgi:hypothetical protein
VKMGDHFTHFPFFDPLDERKRAFLTSAFAMLQ